MRLHLFISMGLCLLLAGCSFQLMQSSKLSASSVSNTGSAAAGLGAKFAGQGSSSVPTGTAVVARIQNGLENNVSPFAGNFKSVLAQVQNNLPKVSDPSKATGYDQIELLIYGACSDLTTGSTPKMKSKYNVDPNASISANQQALVAAGIRMMDRYTAGLASQSSASSQVSSVLSNLVQTLSSTSGDTSKVAFMSVCIAANTAGSTLMGF